MCRGCVACILRFREYGSIFVVNLGLIRSLCLRHTIGCAGNQAMAHSVPTTHNWVCWEAGGDTYTCGSGLVVNLGLIRSLCLRHTIGCAGNQAMAHPVPTTHNWVCWEAGGDRYTCRSGLIVNLGPIPNRFVPSTHNWVCWKASQGPSRAFDTQLGVLGSGRRYAML